MPVVSVVIPTYNMARLLPAAVHSALGQSFSDLEVLVVDDGSTDDTAAVAASLSSDGRVRYLRTANSGSGAARNAGIRGAHGDLVAFLDADDVWLPAKLERQVAAIAGRSGAAGSYTACIDQVIDEQGRERSRLVVRSGSLGALALREKLLYKNVIPGSASSVVARKTALEAAGLFDETLPFYQDADMWCRVARCGELVYVDQPLVVVRIRPTSASTDRERVVRGHLQYLDKLVAETPPELRHHLPRALLAQHCRLATVMLRFGDWRECARQIAAAVRPGPRFALLLVREMASFSVRRARARVSGVRVLS